MPKVYQQALSKRWAEWIELAFDWPGLTGHRYGKKGTIGPGLDRPLDQCWRLERQRDVAEVFAGFTRTSSYRTCTGFAFTWKRERLGPLAMASLHDARILFVSELTYLLAGLCNAVQGLQGQHIGSAGTAIAGAVVLLPR